MLAIPLLEYPFWSVFVRCNNIHSCVCVCVFFVVFVSPLLLCAHIVDIYQLFHRGWILCPNTQLMSLLGIPDRVTTHQDDEKRYRIVYCSYGNVGKMARKWFSATHWWPAWWWEEGYLPHGIHACLCLWFALILEWQIVIVVSIMCYTKLTYNDLHAMPCHVAIPLAIEVILTRYTGKS